MLLISRLQEKQIIQLQHWFLMSRIANYWRLVVITGAKFMSFLHLSAGNGRTSLHSGGGLGWVSVCMVGRFKLQTMKTSGRRCWERHLVSAVRWCDPNVHTHTHTHIQTHTHPHTHNLTDTHTHAVIPHTHRHTHTLSHIHKLTCTHTPLTHTQTHTHTHLTHTQTHTHTSLTHTHTLTHDSRKPKFPTDGS